MQLRVLFAICCCCVLVAKAYDCKTGKGVADDTDDEVSQHYLELELLHENTELAYKSLETVADSLTTLIGNEINRLNNDEMTTNLYDVVDMIDMADLLYRVRYLRARVRALKKVAFPSEKFFLKFYCMDHQQQIQLMLNALAGNEIALE